MQYFFFTEFSHALVRYIEDNFITVVPVTKIDGEGPFKLHEVYPVKFKGVFYEAIIESLGTFTYIHSNTKALQDVICMCRNV